MTDRKDEPWFCARMLSKTIEAVLVCGGRLFHARAAATGNARSPRVARRVDGTGSVGLSTDHSIHGEGQLQTTWGSWNSAEDMQRWMVCWFQNWNWKPTFIKHAHYVQLITLEGRIHVRPPASTARCKVEFSLQWERYLSLHPHPHGRAESIRTHLHISAHSLLSTTVTQDKGNCIKTTINAWLK